MVKKLQDHLDKLGDYSKEDDKSIKFHCKKRLIELFEEYQDLKNVDKVY